MVEVLIACALAAVVLSGVIYLFRQSGSSVRQSGTRATLLQEGRLMLEMVKKDLRSIYWKADDPRTEMRFEHNGIRFARLTDDGSPDGLEYVTWVFDLSRGEVTRNGNRGSLHRFGDEQVQVCFFKIQKLAEATPMHAQCCFQLTIELGERGNPKGKRFSISDKIFPPALQENPAVRWME